MEISDVRDMIKKAHLPEKTVELCLRGDLLFELERLQRQMVEIKSGARSSLADNGGGDVTELVDQMEALSAEMRKETISVTFRALPRKDWAQLMTEHPARKDNPADRQIGMNTDTFFESLIVKSWIAPEIGQDEIQALLDILTSAQFDKLHEATWGLNRRDVDVPFSLNALRSMRPSAQTPKPQPDSESPSNGGTGGSPKRSRSTTTKKAS